MRGSVACCSVPQHAPSPPGDLKNMKSVGALLLTKEFGSFFWWQRQHWTKTVQREPRELTTADVSRRQYPRASPASTFYPDKNCDVFTVSKHTQLLCLFLAALPCFQLLQLSFAYSGLLKSSTGTAGCPLHNATLIFRDR